MDIDVAISCLLGVLCTTFSALPAHGRETVPLYTYYTDPPFDATSNGNFTTKLAAWLGQRSNGRYQFVATALPRSQLDQMIAKPAWRGAVAWVNPHWFGADARRPMLWTAPFMQDSDIVVSRGSSPVAYLDAGLSLAGLTVCAAAGHRLPDLEWLIEAGKLRRVDAGSELGCLPLLTDGRADAALVQAASMDYLKRSQPAVAEGLTIASQPRLTFGRQLVTAAESTRLHGFLEAELRGLASDPAWNGLLPRPPRQLKLVSMVPTERHDSRLLRHAFDKVFERAGLRYSIAWRPSARGLTELRSGLFDGDMGRLASFSHAYPEAIRVDPAYGKIDHVVLTAKGANTPTAPNSLASLRVAVPNGYLELLAFSSSFRRREVVVNPLTCARMAAKRRVDACLTTTDISGHWIGEQELAAQLEVQTFKTHEVHLWLAPGLDKEAASLGRAIADMKRSGELQKLFAAPAGK